MSQIYKLLQSPCDDFYKIAQMVPAALPRGNRGFSRCNRSQTCVMYKPEHSLNLCNLW